MDIDKRLEALQQEMHGIRQQQRELQVQLDSVVRENTHLKSQLALRQGGVSAAEQSTAVALSSIANTSALVGVLAERMETTSNQNEEFVKELHKVQTTLKGFVRKESGSFRRGIQCIHKRIDGLQSAMECIKAKSETKWKNDFLQSEARWRDCFFRLESEVKAALGIPHGRSLSDDSEAAPSKKGHAAVPLYTDVRCSSCKKTPVGMLYKCSECRGYRLCATCKSKGTHSEHRMEKTDSLHVWML